ncbi:MAG: hypothetical protein ACRC1K_18270 [Planctomycetia bacterium]
MGLLVELHSISCLASPQSEWRPYGFTEVPSVWESHPDFQLVLHSRGSSALPTITLYRWSRHGLYLLQSSLFGTSLHGFVLTKRQAVALLHQTWLCPLPPELRRELVPDFQPELFLAGRAVGESALPPPVYSWVDEDSPVRWSRMADDERGTAIAAALGALSLILCLPGSFFFDVLPLEQNGTEPTPSRVVGHCGWMGLLDGVLYGADAPTAREKAFNDWKDFCDATWAGERPATPPSLEPDLEKRAVACLLLHIFAYGLSQVLDRLTDFPMKSVGVALAFVFQMKKKEAAEIFLKLTGKSVLDLKIQQSMKAAFAKPLEAFPVKSSSVTLKPSLAASPPSRSAAGGGTNERRPAPPDLALEAKAKEFLFNAHRASHRTPNHVSVRMLAEHLGVSTGKACKLKAWELYAAENREVGTFRDRKRRTPKTVAYSEDVEAYGDDATLDRLIDEQQRDEQDDFRRRMKSERAGRRRRSPAD